MSDRNESEFNLDGQPADLSSLSEGDPAELAEIIALAIQSNRASNVSRIRDAYSFVADEFKNKKREDGTAYLTHLTEVAKTVAELEADDLTIIAALLHDSVEDIEGITVEVIEEMFGEPVAKLVKGVTKLSKLGPIHPGGEHGIQSEEVRNLENLYRLLFAMAGDSRVMLIKLADRLHNMATIKGKKSATRRTSIASESLLVFAPLASRLGIWTIKSKLEDYAFEILHPEEFKRITKLINQSEMKRSSEMTSVILTVKEALEKSDLKYLQVTGRPKHKFSVYSKMVKQDLAFEEVYDLSAVRIIVDSIEDCYRALRLIHSRFQPVHGFLFDYIGGPKPNGYQSIHTKVIGPNGKILEVQIRTLAMQKAAEYGTAAHWNYKEEGQPKSPTDVLDHQLTEASNDSQDVPEFLEAVVGDILPDKIFVFTPKYQVIELPVGSKVLDFAFRVHTELALKLSSVRVDDEIVPLNTVLKNTQKVELITRTGATPSEEWFKFVTTNIARTRLRNYFRKSNQGVLVVEGRNQLVREFNRLNLDPDVYLSARNLSSVMEMYKSVKTEDDLYARVASELIACQSVVERLRANYATNGNPSPLPFLVSREKGVVIGTLKSKAIFKRAKCCMPVPEDMVIGYLTSKSGLRVHRGTCPEIQALLESEPEKCFACTWEVSSMKFQVPLKIQGVDREGLLASASKEIAELGVNISNIRMQTQAQGIAEIFLTVDVASSSSLNTVISSIAGLQDVISVNRVFRS